MTASDSHRESINVAELLQATFEPQAAGPLDPSMIQLMLELAHAPDGVLPVKQAAPAPARKPLFRSLLTGRFRRGH